MGGQEESQQQQQQQQPTTTCSSPTSARLARRPCRTAMSAAAAPRRLSSLLALLAAVIVLLQQHADPQRQSSFPAFFVHSFPSGAGGCQGGEAAVGGAHLNATIRPIIRGASLSEGGFVVAIGGVPLRPTATEQFDLNTDYDVTVTATEYAYKGCLIRLEALDGQDTTAALAPGLNTGPAAACEAPVVGITHVLPIFKQVHSGTINLSQQGQIALDVTIVGLNNETASLYAYEGFRVQFGDPPTAAPVTEAPSPAPATIPATLRPVILATRSPVATPVGENTTTPATTPAPTIAATTVAPTAAPVATEAPSTAAPSTEAATDATPEPSTAAPSTEAATDATPPSSPTGTPSQAPDDEPTPSSPTGTPPGTSMSQIVQNMVLPLQGVSRELTLFELIEWESVTETWFNDFYNKDRKGRGRRNLQAAGEKYGVVTGSMYNTIHNVRTSLDEDNQEFTIVYDHKYTYEKTDDATMGPLQYATLPFRSTSANAAYREELQVRLQDALSGMLVVPVPKIEGPNYEKAPVDDGLSGGAVAGICIAVLSVVGVGAVVAYKKRADTLEKKRSAAAVHSAQAIDREAFSFDAVVVPANASFQSNENIASTSSIPGLGSKSMLPFNPELLYTVYAPKGKLGIVLENPDNEGPIVYIVRDSSPLRDKMQVGDRLIAVDEVDVRSMSPVKISKLISKRSANPVRKMTLLKVPPKSDEDDERAEKEEQQQIEGGGEEEKESDGDDVYITAENLSPSLDDSKDPPTDDDAPEATPELLPGTL